MFTVNKRLLSLTTGCVVCIGSLISGTTTRATDTVEVNSEISETEQSQSEIPFPSLEPTAMPLPNLEPTSITKQDLEQDALAPSLEPIATLLPTPEPTATPVATPEPTKVPTVKIRIQPFREIKAKKVKFLYSKGYIRVRKKATKKSSSKFLLKPGQKVKIIKESGKKWVKVRISKKKTGYVLKEFLANQKKKAKKAFNNKVENFRLTGYCSCAICSEGWGTRTRSGRQATAGRTIAADLSVLPMYTHVYIQGLGEYTVEDVGGGVKGRHIDVFCNAHYQCSKVTRNVAKVIEIEG